jgi:rod shape determining protein RodA
MFERRLYHHIDWMLLGAVVLLALIGVAMIYSATFDPTPGRQRVGPQFWTQLIALALGLTALAVCLAVDYRILAEHALLIYAATVALLVYVLLFGTTMGGARRWIAVGPFNLQPSEFVRPALALVLAAFFGDNRRGARSWGDVLWAGAFTAVPALLIAREPDLGTALALVPVVVGVLFVAGLRLRVLVGMALVGVLVAPLAWAYALEDYQRERLATFLEPQRDPRGAGYQQLQARITVGSGGLTGKGFLQGTQGQYNFLPVAHNDFIFSVLAEEHGFLGVLLALGLYLFVMLRSLEAARLAKDRLGAYLVVGILSGFAFQVLYNITMSAGLAPVKGLTLPLMSYGGSSLIATLAGFGLILNVRMRRFTN